MPVRYQRVIDMTTTTAKIEWLFDVTHLWQVLSKLKSITHELESKELDRAARNLQV